MKIVGFKPLRWSHANVAPSWRGRTYVLTRRGMRWHVFVARPGLDAFELGEYPNSDHAKLSAQQHHEACALDFLFDFLEIET